jgi:hypothetical protein
MNFNSSRIAGHENCLLGSALGGLSEAGAGGLFGYYHGLNPNGNRNNYDTPEGSKKLASENSEKTEEDQTVEDRPKKDKSTYQRILDFADRNAMTLLTGSLGLKLGLQIGKQIDDPIFGGRAVVPSVLVGTTGGIALGRYLDKLRNKKKEAQIKQASARAAYSILRSLNS